MAVSYQSLIGEQGSIARSGFTIYDPLRGNPDLLLTAAQLEAVLNDGLSGLDLNYPLRTRSKVLKSKICEILGYPVPKSFKKTRPRFVGQDFDTYIQKSNNLQIWNEEIVPTRRYVIIRVDESSKVVRVRVVTGEVIAKLDTTGTLTKKYQARSREPITQSVLVSPSDSYTVGQVIAALPNNGQVRVSEAAGSRVVDFKRFMPIKKLYAGLLGLVGKRLPDPGTDQERNRGAGLHRTVCETLGLESYADAGSFPDVVEQLLELKLQTSPTIDLGLVSPDDSTTLDIVPGIRHADVRYGVFYATLTAGKVRIDQVVVTRGEDFFKFFQRFEGKVINAKLQIPLPRDFFA
jgi:hypothetical protein